MASRGVDQACQEGRPSLRVRYRRGFGTAGPGSVGPLASFLWLRCFGAVALARLFVHRCSLAFDGNCGMNHTIHDGPSHGAFLKALFPCREG